MSNSPQNPSVTLIQEHGIFRLLVSLAVVLCIACCMLILLVPTESINVDTVYQGF
jgi:hypothetical protein